MIWRPNLTKRIVILTGAGISAESGIATFRDKDGLWENHPVERVATPEAFLRDPALVHKFYNERRRQLLSAEVQENPAHTALAKLENELPGQVTIVTQNIDDLHERGGSTNVIHMHGELLKMFCTSSHERFEIRQDIQVDHECGCCGLKGTLRPDIVWFGEVPYQMEEIISLCERADLFISIGTSGHVYPAAGLCDIASSAQKLEINADATQISAKFDKNIVGLAGVEVPKLVDNILAGNRRQNGN